MDSDGIFQIIIMLILMIFSVYFAAAETAFTSMNRTFLKALAEDGNKRAVRVLKISEDYNKLLSTILIGTNIVAIAMASVGTVFFIANVSYDHGAAISAVLITIIVLVFGDVTPKSIAKENAENIAIKMAYSISFFLFIFTPINFLLSFVKRFVSKVLKPERLNSAKENELLALIDEAEQVGEFDSDESELIRSAIEFNDALAVEIFTPRVDIIAVEQDTEIEQIAKAFSSSGYSRLPVYKGNIDHIVGTITGKDFYSKVHNRASSIKRIIKRPFFITGSMRIIDLLKHLQKSKQHMAFIADEYGGTLGLVTMEDILEELVGEIWDEHDDILNDVVENFERNYTVLCSMYFEEFCEYFDIECETEVNTVGGFVMEMLDKMPQVGDSFEFEGLSVSVSKADDKRAEEIKVVDNREPNDEEE